MPETAITRTVVVTDPAGLHLRTASAIANVVRRFEAAVTLIKGDQRTSATAGVLQIVATMISAPGEKVTLEAVGPDAAAALDALEPLFAGIFGDETQKSA